MTCKSMTAFSCSLSLHSRIMISHRVASEPFRLEEYFAKHEFSAKYLICCSDCESWSIHELLAIADEECKDLWNNLRCGYTETHGHPVLRKECAKQAGMNEENVLMFAGAEEGIFCAFNTILSEDSHAIVMTPCYQSLLSIAEAICPTTRFDLDYHNGWAIDLERLEAAIVPGKTKLIVLNFPHNPSGSNLPRSSFDGVVAIARKYDLWLFCDEVYKGIDRANVEDIAPSVATVYEKGVSLSGLSKAHGLPGLRIGWILSQNVEWLHLVNGHKHYLSICNSAPSEILGLIAVRFRHVLWSRNQRIVEENIALFDAFLARYPEHFEWVKPTGGCCGFLRVKTIAAGKTLGQVADQIVEDHGLMLLPGENFPCSEANREFFNSFMRIGLGRKNFPETLAVFESCLGKLIGN